MSSLDTVGIYSSALRQLELAHGLEPGRLDDYVIDNKTSDNTHWVVDQCNTSLQWSVNPNDDELEYLKKWDGEYHEDTINNELYVSDKTTIVFVDLSSGHNDEVAMIFLNENRETINEDEHV